MTTTVHVSVAGNKPVRIGVANEDGTAATQEVVVQPPSGAHTLGIHGTQYVYVIEDAEPVEAVPNGGEDFALPEKTVCDKDRPEGCESCQ